MDGTAPANDPPEEAALTEGRCSVGSASAQPKVPDRGSEQPLPVRHAPAEPAQSAETPQIAPEEIVRLSLKSIAEVQESGADGGHVSTRREAPSVELRNPPPSEERPANPGLSEDPGPEPFEKLSAGKSRMSDSTVLTTAKNTEAEADPRGETGNSPPPVPASSAQRGHGQERQEAVPPPQAAGSGESKAPSSHAGQARETNSTSEPGRGLQSSEATRLEGAAAPAPGVAISGDRKEGGLQTSTRPSSPGNDFFAQFVEKMQIVVRNGNGEIHIQLKPENLGRLEIKAESGASGVIARITAESVGVKNYLENNLHILQQGLQEQGLKVERIDVTVQGNLDARHSSPQYQNSGHNGAANQHGSALGASLGRGHDAGTQDEILIEAATLRYLSPNSTFHTTA